MQDVLEIAEKVFKKIKGVWESGAVFVSNKLSRQVRFSVNKIDVVKEWNEINVSVLVEKEKKSIIVDLSFPALEDINVIVEKIKKALEITPPKPYYAPLPEPAADYPQIANAFDKKTMEDPSKMIDKAKIAIDEALKEGVKKVAGAIYTNAYRTALITSAGFKNTWSYTNCYIDVRAFNEPIETGHYSQAGRSIDDLDPKKAGREAAKYANLSKNPKKLEEGEYKTLFVADAVASLINFVGFMLSGFAVIAGYSTFAQKLGRKVASEKFSLLDVPLREDAYNPRIFDMEGVPTRNITPIDNGELKTYLHNRITAMLFKTQSTGHAGWIFPTPWNLAIKPGDQSEEELISQIDRGLIIGNVTYIRFQDYIKGDFSGIIRDGVIYVENGEPKHGVKGLRLSDNLISWLSNITGIGKEERQIYHWWLELGIPVYSVPLLVDKARFTKAW